MNGLGLRLALLLHPAGYRRERGEELTAVFADIAEGSGRWAGVRELADLAGHGVRLRLRLGSDRVPAQLAALAAPFAATAAVAGGLANQLAEWERLQRFGFLLPALRWQYTTPRPHMIGFLSGQVGLLLSVLGALAACFGRWAAARTCALLGLVLTLVCAGLALTLSPSWAEGAWLLLAARTVVRWGPQVLWVLILLAAPRDLLGPPTLRRSLAALAGAVTGGLLLDTALGLGPFSSLNYSVGEPLALALGAAELALLAVSVPALLRGRPGPAGAAVAGSPIAALMLFTVMTRVWNSGGHATALALFAAAVLLAVALGHWRPRLTDRRPPTAG